MACIFANLANISTWNRFTLDRILDMGDDLYVKTIQMSVEDCLVDVPPNKVFNSVFMQRQKVIFLIDNNSKTVAQLVSTSEEKVKEMFKQNLEDFFQKYHSGIFFMASKPLAIWIQNCSFYVFDPTEHQFNGNPWKGIAGIYVLFFGRGYCYVLIAEFLLNF